MILSLDTDLQITFKSYGLRNRK